MPKLKGLKRKLDRLIVSEADNIYQYSGLDLAAVASHPVEVLFRKNIPVVSSQTLKSKLAQSKPEVRSMANLSGIDEEGNTDDLITNVSVGATLETLQH